MGILEIFRRNGFFNVVYKVLSLVRSKYIAKKLSYGSGFFVGLSTLWIGGRGAKIGNGFKMGRRGRVEVIHFHNGNIYSPSLTIGDNVSLNDDVHIACIEAVTIGNDVLMASKIFISDHDHGGYNGPFHDSPAVSPNDRNLVSKPVVIGNRVWIGEMVSILPGVTIGHGSIIGAGSVVTKSLPENCIAVGVPAKVVKRFNQDLQIWEKTHE